MRLTLNAEASGSTQVEEREPFLLPADENVAEHNKEVTPLPKLQLSIVLFLQLVEPLSNHVISPFINQLVRELDIIGGDPKKVGYYVGVIESMLFVFKAITIFFWSRLSDYIGRKPILLICIAGACVSIVSFGLSKSFWGLVICRCITGVANGKIGVIKTMMGELTDSTNMARAFAFIAVMFATGGTIGPLAGGFLSHPHERFSGIFGGKLWEDFPYLLPCLFSASFTAFSFFLVLFFLKETVTRSRKLAFASSPIANGPIAVRKLMTWPILLSLANYGLIALSDISLFALMPLFYSTTIELGGLGFDTATIGICLGVYGVADGTLQALFFAKIVEIIGPKRLIISSLTVLPLIFALFPLMNQIARVWGATWGLWALLLFQLLITVYFSMSFGAIFMFITTSAPSKRSLGSVNGMAETTVSVSRAVGPVLATSLFAYSIQTNWLGGNAVYLILTMIDTLNLFLAVRLPHEPWKHDDL